MSISRTDLLKKINEQRKTANVPFLYSKGISKLKKSELKEISDQLDNLTRNNSTEDIIKEEVKEPVYLEELEIEEEEGEEGEEEGEEEEEEGEDKLEEELEDIDNELVEVNNTLNNIENNENYISLTEYDYNKMEDEEEESESESEDDLEKLLSKYKKQYIEPNKSKEPKRKEVKEPKRKEVKEPKRKEVKEPKRKEVKEPNIDKQKIIKITNDFKFIINDKIREYKQYKKINRIDEEYINETIEFYNNHRKDSENKIDKIMKNSNENFDIKFMAKINKEYDNILIKMDKTIS